MYKNTAITVKEEDKILKNDNPLEAKNPSDKETHLTKAIDNITKNLFSEATPYYGSSISEKHGKIIPAHKAPEGFVHLPGISCSAYFPVIGFSMEPHIHNGDIIGVKPLSSWNTIDPDKIYFILTDEDKMIKHLRTDADDTSVLWGISPNYKEFKILKTNIKAIYIVVFRGRLL